MDEGFEFVNAAAQADNGGIPGTVNGNTVSGTIDIPNNDFDVSFTNRWLTKEIDIIKVDENGDKLGGAKFTLTKGQDGIAEFTSNTSAPETIGLGKGIYCLTETVAPDGYIILSNKIYFKVNPDGTVVLCNEAGETEVEYGGGTTPVTYDNASVSNPPDVVRGTVSVSNEPGTELPNTGGSGTLLYTMSGFALICAAALLYGFRMRRRERRFR
jgi:LPXTG-motif cell wall-anchored protein